MAKNDGTEIVPILDLRIKQPIRLGGRVFTRDSEGGVEVTELLPDWVGGGWFPVKVRQSFDAPKMKDLVVLLDHKKIIK